MQNKEIIIFMPSLGGGGAEKIVLRLMEGFVLRGIKVTIILATPHGRLHFEIPREVNVVHLKSKHTIFSVLKLTNYLRKYKPKLLLSHLARANRIAILSCLLSRAGTRLFVVEHNTMSVAITKYSRLQKLILLSSYKYLYRYAERIIHVSKAAAEDLSRMLPTGRNDVLTIYNPIVDSDKLEKNSIKPPDPWMKSKEYPIILGVGRLTEQKDFLNLVNAFLIIKRTNDARLIILGEGNQRSLLEDAVRKLGIAEFVRLPGFVENAQQYMKYASVFVLSSRWEALPTVLVEAMACGCPVVSTDCPSGPAEILENGKYGKLVRVGDPSALADAMLETLLNPPDKKMLIERAMDFSVDSAVDEYLRVMGLQ
jgi:glycosyltransferase involved in cell wall biosynthesis